MEPEQQPIPETGRPLPQDKFRFLQELTSSRIHGSKTFYEHLFRVYTYLKEHNAPEEVCDAGLFHSIYGTEFYAFQDNHITREVVRGFIGDYAEELVYIFCTTKDRFDAMVSNTIGLSDRQARDLCCIEFANLRDQNRGGKYRTKLITLAETTARLESGSQCVQGSEDKGAEVPDNC